MNVTSTCEASHSGEYTEMEQPGTNEDFGVYQIDVELS